MDKPIKFANKIRASILRRIRTYCKSHGLTMWVWMDKALAQAIDKAEQGKEAA